MYTQLAQIPAENQELIAKGFFDTATSLANSTTALIQVVGTVVAFGLVLITAVLTKGKVSAIVGSGVVAALILWLLFGGVLTSRDMIKEDIDNAFGVENLDQRPSSGLTL